MKLNINIEGTKTELENYFQFPIDKSIGENAAVFLSDKLSLFNTLKSDRIDFVMQSSFPRNKLVMDLSSEYCFELLEKCKTKFQCHSSTSKEEILNFVNTNKGELISVLYECDGYPYWGNDEDVTYNTSDESEFNNLLDLIESHYIHALEVKNK